MLKTSFLITTLINSNQFWRGNLKQTDGLHNLVVDGRIIFK